MGSTSLREQPDGADPPALGTLTNLDALELYNNKLTGSIPPALGTLTNLDALELYNNKLTGSIPPALGDLDNLYILWVVPVTVLIVSHANSASKLPILSVTWWHICLYSISAKQTINLSHWRDVHAVGDDDDAALLPIDRLLGG